MNMLAFAASKRSPTKPTSIAPTDCNVPHAGDDGTSSLSWSPTSNNLVSSNWDGSVRYWQVHEEGGKVSAVPKALVNHENNAPVLDTCFSADGSTIFSVGTDKAVRMWDGQAPSRNIPQQIGAHDAPVKSVGYLPSGLVASGGWDRKLKFWDKRQPNPAGQLDMPGKIQDLDIRDNLMVVATHDRHIISFNVAGAQPVEHLPRKKSSLDFQTRCVSCFPDSKGYAVGSIGGRVQIQYLQEDKPGKKSFPFMCHRQDRSAFSINAIAFNSKYGTFVTAGSDGVINTWDKNLKRRVGKASEPIGRPITCANFNAQGNLLAYASSYDWSKGSTHDVQQGNEIFIHYVLEEEIKPKGKNPPASPRAY